MGEKIHKTKQKQKNKHTNNKQPKKKKKKKKKNKGAYEIVVGLNAKVFPQPSEYHGRVVPEREIPDF
jgi:hypothetical protein